MELLLRWNKVEKDDQILCPHLDSFRWPGHIFLMDLQQKFIKCNSVNYI